MHMTFWWSCVQDNFLFPGYDIKTAGGFLSTCLGLISLAIVLEYLKLLQAQQRQKEIFLRARQIRTLCPGTADSSNLLINKRRLPKKLTLFARSQMVVWEIFLWINLQVFGYLLMLVVMGYNGWMVISIIIGSAIGYFFFGPCFLKINLENCQVIRETFCAANCGDAEQQDGETTPVLQASTSSVTTPDNETSACIHHSNVV